MQASLPQEFPTISPAGVRTVKVACRVRPATGCGKDTSMQAWAPHPSNEKAETGGGRGAAASPAETRRSATPNAAWDGRERHRSATAARRATSTIFAASQRSHSPPDGLAKATTIPVTAAPAARKAWGQRRVDRCHARSRSVPTQDAAKRTCSPCASPHKSVHGRAERATSAIAASAGRPQWRDAKKGGSATARAAAAAKRRPYHAWPTEVVRKRTGSTAVPHPDRIGEFAAWRANQASPATFRAAPSANVFVSLRRGVAVRHSQAAPATSARPAVHSADAAMGGALSCSVAWAAGKAPTENP
ncbi:MAG: hypothetical protein ACYDBQ_03105 [Thermoplasmatota archaeon]